MIDISVEKVIAATKVAAYMIKSDLHPAVIIQTKAEYMDSVVISMLKQCSIFIVFL